VPLLDRQTTPLLQTLSSASQKRAASGLPPCCWRDSSRARSVTSIQLGFLPTPKVTSSMKAKSESNALSAMVALCAITLRSCGARPTGALACA